jgi:predicted metal-dependent hydrolase
MTRPVIALTGALDWADDVKMLLGEHGFALVEIDATAGYVARLADDGAAMVLVHADHAEESDWRFWVTTPKASAATRRIPIIAVSADSVVREDALDSGADASLPPDELLANLPRLLTQLARVQDPSGRVRLVAQCQEPLPPLARQGIEEFNAGEYYRQHDLFEELWMAEEGPVRDLYRAILQVGIAYYQIARGNHRGALKMLLRSVQWLFLLPDVCQGVDVKQLREDAGCVRAALERTNPEDIESFDRSLLKPVRLLE